ncbi:MAG: tRNA (N6-isopentenyl adenosine(37)-C2)-methylthiotransferase MiaB [Campylobacterales bacterium]|nr:tRNA (N6-isopentenyl adenosine(37)-C2)-methylthiotransferase MiaB [Campylobacterales bacterium]
MKKLFIQTIGCQMNVRDSEHMIAELTTKDDFELTENIKEADLILINTCSVREKPVQKLFSEIGHIRKQKKSDAKIGVCGCTASHLGETILKKSKYVNFVLGARNVSKITEIINKDKAVMIDLSHDDSQYAFADFRQSLYKAYINISIGCDKQCTFCIVPHTRGEEVSIPVELILNETKKAVLNGAKEIFLLGQNVNNYGRRFSSSHDDINFTELLKRVSDIDGVERIRFTSPHPLHMDDEFLNEFARNPKICKSMHMPLQSGSTKILKEMRRGYSKEWFLDRAFKVRDLVKNAHVSTDIITAFPNESDEDFLDTIDVMEKVRFEQIFSFRFSPRPLTKAAEFENQISDDVALERLNLVQKLHQQQLDEITKNEVGNIHEVLFEELRENGFVAGRSFNNFLIKVKGSEELLGVTKKVKIINSSRMALTGSIVD